MPLTRSFNDLIKSRVAADPAFRQALLQEAAPTMPPMATSLPPNPCWRHYQRYDRLRASRAGRRDAAQEPDADVRPAKGTRLRKISLASSACCKEKPECASKWQPSRSRRRAGALAPSKWPRCAFRCRHKPEPTFTVLNQIDTMIFECLSRREPIFAVFARSTRLLSP